jgi:hypothetical protein
MVLMIDRIHLNCDNMVLKIDRIHLNCVTMVLMIDIEYPWYHHLNVFSDNHEYYGIII